MGARRRDLLLAAAATPWAGVAAPVDWDLRLPQPPFHEPAPHPFNDALLTAALQRLGDRVQLRRGAPQTWARQIRELALGRVDVAPLPANDGAYTGQPLLRVDQPLRPGLLGLRLLLARRDRLAELGRFASLDAPRRGVRIGYGADWADRELLQRLGYRLELARSTEGLFELLLSGRCDVLSRGVKEVDGELRRYGRVQREIVVLPGIALHFPLDDCFFVAPQRQDLHAALGEGLQRLRADGGWVQLLAQHYGGLLRDHDIGARQIWSLPGYPPPRGLDAALLDPRPWLPKILAAA